MVHIYRKIALAIVVLLALPSLVHAQVLEEIIVTAQKRAQSIQDVPISVAAISGDAIANRSIDSLSVLSNSVPNLYITESQIDSRIQIRGIFTGANKGFEQSVAMYSDGIYYGRSQLIRLPLVDIDRVEVLRGPQPTLFGKNAIAGAVSVWSARPTDEFEGSVSVSYEVEHKEPQVTGIISGPITDRVSGRFVASYRELDGYFTNQVLNRKEPEIEEKFFRGTLEWDAGDNLLFRLKGEYSEFGREGWPLEIHTPIGNFSAVYDNFGVESGEDYRNESSRSNSLNEVTDLVFNIEYSLGEHTLTAVTGYVDYDTTEIVDVDYTRLVILDDTNQAELYEQISQEIRLTSPGGQKIDYIAGVYYQDGELTVTDEVFLGSALRVNSTFAPLADSNTDRLYTQDATLWSVFAQADIHFTEALTLTLGARYSQEDKQGSRLLEIVAGPTNTGINLPAAGPTAPAYPNLLGQLYAGGFNIFPHDVSGSRDEDSFNPMANLQYQFTDHVMAYISYAKGSKAGGFDIRGNSIAGNPVVTAGTFEFEDEEATSYELGVKLNFSRVQVNIALYNTEYTDLQTSIFDGSLGFLVENASEATTQGFEVDGRVAISDSLTLYGALAYLDFEYDKFEGAPCYFVAGEPAATCSLTGKRALSTPEWTGSFGLDFRQAIGNSLEFDANLSANYSDEYYNMANLDPRSLQKAYTTFGLVLGLGSSNGNWRVSLIGDNLSDEVIHLTTGALPLATTFTQRGGIAYDGFYNRPRNYTLKFEYNF